MTAPTVVPFWWRVPGWVVEIVSGLLLQGWLHWVVGRHTSALVFLGVGLGMSLFYEGVLDRNGFSWRDVGQRGLGQLAAEILLSGGLL